MAKKYLRLHDVAHFARYAKEAESRNLGYYNYLYTLWIKRIEHRKFNRGHSGPHQLGQPVAPSFLFPVFNPPYPQGTVGEKHSKMQCKFKCRTEKHFQT